jgi:hypothetical protein
MPWQETTLRKGTKTPKICRDMFITDSRGVFKFCEVKNGTLAMCREITKDDAVAFITNQNLVPSASIFNKCYTYRTIESTKLIQSLLRADK